MKKFNPKKYKKMVQEFQANDNPLGWFNSIYTDAQGDHNNVFWADLQVNPYLLEWIRDFSPVSLHKKAIVIGCGVAQALSEAGYDVTAFDIAPEAINLCKKRYKETKVHYIVADLFNYPQEWFHNFDLIYECNTIQVLPGKYRLQAQNAMISLMADDASLLVSCRSRALGAQKDDIPLPLDKNEMDIFKNSGLAEESFLAYDDTQVPPVPHFFASYKKLSLKGV